MMNKFMVIAGGVGIIGMGALGFQAIQSHAQNVVPATHAVVTKVAQTSQVQDVTSTTDTDNIQNDVGGVDTPDAIVGDTSSVTDPVDSTSTIEKGNQEHGENTTSGVNEVEDAN